MRKTTTAKTANVGRIPPKLVTIPPTKAHTKRTATYATKPTSNHFTKIFMPIGMEPKPRFKSCCISVLFFITLTFLCFVGGFTLLVSGGRFLEAPTVASHPEPCKGNHDEVIKMRKLLFEEKEIRKYGKIREYCYRLNQYMTIHNMVGVKPNRLKTVWMRVVV